MLTLKIILIMKTTTHMATNIPIQVIWNSLKSNKTYGLVKQLYNSNLSANYMQYISILKIFMV